ncbi:molybdenum cofactor guanylyltransferase [Ornithinibacillus sp. 179-J 7C1 HS]|uniref:molybdenum cofactor guanylyltransferase n=1 Tax=Ornithinibacillus sp. 179-J 7C1 HS TaxID=3142384 RepID=UPI0039A0F0CC
MGEVVAGIVLAGGKSSRFGYPKAFAEKDGLPFYQFTIDAMQPFIDSIILVTSNELLSNFREQKMNMKITTDQPEIAGLGPLAGIFSGMDEVNAEWYLVCPIDVPFIKKEVFDLLLKHRETGSEAIVPIVNGRVEPLISIFHCSMKDRIKEQIRLKEYAPKQLFTKTHVTYVEILDERPFRNINYQEDLEKYNQKGEGKEC